SLIETRQLAEAARLARAEKARTLKPHFHEGGLHAGQHALHAAKKDIADERVSRPAGPRLEVVFHGAFEKELHGTSILDDGNARLARTDIDQNFFGHKNPDLHPPRPHAIECPLFTLNSLRILDASILTLLSAGMIGRVRPLKSQDNRLRKEAPQSRREAARQRRNASRRGTERTSRQAPEWHNRPPCRAIRRRRDRRPPLRPKAF